jgi:hypothetical protein
LWCKNFGDRLPAPDVKDFVRVQLTGLTRLLGDQVTKIGDYPVLINTNLLPVVGGSRTILDA